MLIVGDEARKKQVIEALIKETEIQQGKNARESKTYARIVNQDHHARVTGLLKDGKVVYGGHVDAADRYVDPTIMDCDQSSRDCRILRDEIFGPLLPTLTFPQLDDAIKYINDQPKALALYVFSSNTKNIEKVLSQTTSGSACVNEAVLQYLNNYLPFGGVGPSGVGSSHGKAGFQEFSHGKSVLYRGTWSDVPIRYLPHVDQGWVQKAFSYVMGMN